MPTNNPATRLTEGQRDSYNQLRSLATADEWISRKAIDADDEALAALVAKGYAELHPRFGATAYRPIIKHRGGKTGRTLNLTDRQRRESAERLRSLNERRNAATVAKLHAAARELFHETGAIPTRSQVGERAGYSYRTAYYHIKTGADLVAACGIQVTTP